ncbi:hypothetical protein [Nonomuraea dietziae]|uniref:hypothetical protein n=1 Tax=Nonomuraea dietziae TaxID=65515 RepID=UPI0033D8D00B
MEPLTLIAAGAALGAGVLSGVLRDFLQRLLGRSKDIVISFPPASRIEDRAEELADLLKRSTTLLNELSSEMEARTATVRALQAEAEYAQNLASIHRDAQEALEKMLDARLATRLEESGKKSFKQGMWLNIASGAFFFVAGVLATLALGR